MKFSFCAAIFVIALQGWAVGELSQLSNPLWYVVAGFNICLWGWIAYTEARK